MKVGDKVKITAAKWWNQGFHGKIGEIVSKNNDDTWMVMFDEYVEAAYLRVTLVNQCEFGEEEMQIV